MRRPAARPQDQRPPVSDPRLGHRPLLQAPVADVDSEVSQRIGRSTFVKTSAVLATAPIRCGHSRTHVITYSVTLDVPAETATLLNAERAGLGREAGTTACSSSRSSTACRRSSAAAAAMPGAGRPSCSLALGYDNPRVCRYLRRRGITARIARIGRDPSARLGRHHRMAMFTAGSRWGALAAEGAGHGEGGLWAGPQLMPAAPASA